MAAVSILPGCRNAIMGDADFTVWGGQGLRNGFLIRPRAVCAHKGEVYVIDTTGRVQVFTENGAFIRGWSLPEHENGTPTGVAFGREGNLLIPDTHYSRILEYTPGGKALRSWGSYGTADDQFIYPTGIVQASDGYYYVSEYGMGAELVRKFDKDRRLVKRWGGHGQEPGQFNRAMAIALDEGAGIYVADTANHRMQRFDREGGLLSVIGEPGTRPGQLKFPHDIDIGPDGSIFVAEYGAHRISRFSGKGEFIACYGSPGRGPGQFNGPRGVTVSDKGMVFVADTDNHRIQRFEPGRAE